MMTKNAELCPTCEWLNNAKTNICTPKNPIFDCKYKNIDHIHRWCRNGHMWITDPKSENLLFLGAGPRVKR